MCSKSLSDLFINTSMKFAAGHKIWILVNLLTREFPRGLQYIKIYRFMSIICLLYSVHVNTWNSNYFRILWQHPLHTFRNICVRVTLGRYPFKFSIAQLYIQKLKSLANVFFMTRYWSISNIFKSNHIIQSSALGTQPVCGLQKGWW